MQKTEPMTCVRTVTFIDGSGFTVIHREPRSEEQWEADFKRIAEREGKTICESSADLKGEV